MFLLLIGRWKPREETHQVKNEITSIVLKTNVKVQKANKMLYNKDTAYYLAKSMGVRIN